MIIITWASIIFCVIACIVFSMILFGDTFFPEDKKRKIPFQRFCALYRIAPDNWDLRDGYVRYKHIETTTVRYGPLDWPTSKNTEAEFYFNLTDAVRYHRFRKQLLKDEKKKEVDQLTVDVLRCWQADIDKYLKENAKNVAENVDKTA